MSWVDSNWLRVAGYVVVAGLLLFAKRRERVRAAGVDGVWPPFWTATAGFVVMMAIGRLVEIGDVITAFGRSEAVDSGWYQSRRSLQAVVVGAVGVAWFIVVSVACWRTPERRRRYLPAGLTVITIAAFAAVRAVSLHQVDGLLYRRDIGGLRVATFVELVLLGIAAAATAWVPRSRARRSSAHVPSAPAPPVGEIGAADGRQVP